MSENPMYISDNDAQDYLVYDQKNSSFIFDTIYRCSAVPHIEEAIQKPGATIQIAFHVQTSVTETIKDILSSTQPTGDVWGHSELWFGKNIARMVTYNDGTYLASLPPRGHESPEWEIFTLPFHDTLKAFRIANNIVQTTTLQRIGYGIYFLRVVNHVLAQWLDVMDEVERSHPDDELNPLDPSTWKGGVFCSQIVLLFLKACVLQDAIRIADKQKEKTFLETYSHICLPSDLRKLLKDTWGDGIPVEYITFE
jgi:hypothetical protein